MCVFVMYMCVYFYYGYLNWWLEMTMMIRYMMYGICEYVCVYIDVCVFVHVSLIGWLSVGVVRTYARLGFHVVVLHCFDRKRFGIMFIPRNKMTNPFLFFLFFFASNSVSCVGGQHSAGIFFL